jgi:hypothetical protein
VTAPLVDATTKRAFVVAGVLAAVGAGIALYMRHTYPVCRLVRTDVVMTVQDFKRDIEAVMNDEHADAAAIEAALERIDHEQDKWKDFSTETEIVAARSALLDRLTRLEQIHRKDDRVPVAKIRDDAKAFAALPSTTPHQGLAKYAETEDYVRKAMIDAKKAKNTADENSYTATYKALLAESDEYAHRVITPEFIESVPWTDLLSGEMATRWSKSTTASGPSCRIENGVMTLTAGVTGILDQNQDNLRHFVLDMEFAVEGVVTMFFHVSPAPENPDERQSYMFDLVGGKRGCEPGRTYKMTVTALGSDLVVHIEEPKDVNGGGVWSPDPSWAKLRKGGIAFLVPEGARLKVTRMRIKDLR